MIMRQAFSRCRGPRSLGLGTLSFLFASVFFYLPFDAAHFFAVHYALFLFVDLEFIFMFPHFLLLLIFSTDSINPLNATASVFNNLFPVWFFPTLDPSPLSAASTTCIRMCSYHCMLQHLRLEAFLQILSCRKLSRSMIVIDQRGRR